MTQSPQVNIERCWPLVYAALVAEGQASVASCAGAIGTIACETASTFLPVREAYWLPVADAYRYYADTTKHAPYDGGPEYHGRGFIQLTHRYNYQKMADELGIPGLVRNPDLALSDAEVAARIFARYWAARDLQAAADRGDWRHVRGAVVGFVTNPPGLDRVRNIAIALVNMA